MIFYCEELKKPNTSNILLEGLCVWDYNISSYCLYIMQHLIYLISDCIKLKHELLNIYIRSAFKGKKDNHL